MISGIEAGKGIVIGGGSPSIFTLPADILETNPVIGLNKWFLFRPDRMDYWICGDTGIFYRDFGHHIQGIQCPKFMRERNALDELDQKVPDGTADHWFKLVPGYDIPTEKTWGEGLRMISTTFTAAVHLAIILGCPEAYLFGIDLIGDMSFTGEPYGFDWIEHAEGVNRLLREFQKDIKIFKTVEDSPLDVPFLAL